MARYERKDHYYQQAKREGRASRAAFKLDELQARYRLVRRGERVVDLGCAPGGWLQPLAEWVGPTGRVIGVDQRPVTIPLPAQVITLVADIGALAKDPTPILLRTGGLVALVLSDIAPNTSGTRFHDQVRSLNLARASWACAAQLLAPGGHFVVKIFEGPDVAEFRRALRTHFTKVVTVDPQATRKGSFERYFVCLQKVDANAP
ncbi:MAG: RlmE family RNA methyltransferase [Deltaproteobacteria bacterium]|nr:RlmE family RNA methyltransferase [Deltaproteobacteria bacterium]